MSRILVILASTLVAALLRPLIGNDGLATIGATIIGAFVLFCIGHRLIAGTWPKF